jgi:hypothetical protein
VLGLDVVYVVVSLVALNGVPVDADRIERQPVAPP